MTAEDLEIIANSFWIPKADISVTEWAEANLYLSERVSSSAGPYSTMLTPYVREPLETFKDEKIRLMVLCWGAQTSKTTTILAGMGYRLDMKPTPTMWVMPNENLARSFSEYRWMPMVDDCPALARHKPNNPDRYKLMEQHFDKMSIWFSEATLRPILHPEVSAYYVAMKLIRWRRRHPRRPTRSSWPRFEPRPTRYP